MAGPKLDETMSDSKTLNVGDVVELNSGSPHLTVTAVTPVAVSVTWMLDQFSGIQQSAAPQFAAFPPVCVKLIKAAA